MRFLRRRFDRVVEPCERLVAISFDAQRGRLYCDAVLTCRLRERVAGRGEQRLGIDRLVIGSREKLIALGDVTRHLIGQRRRSRGDAKEGEQSPRKPERV